MSVNTDINKHTLVICANMFVKKDDKWLMLHRSAKKHIAPNIIHPIGGKVNTSEDPYIAALRELEEEAGIKVKNIKLEAVVTEETHPKSQRYECNWQIFNFSSEYLSGTEKETDEGELMWMTKEEILAGNLFPSMREMIEIILDKAQGTIFAKFKYNENDELLEKAINVLPLNI